MNSNQEVQVSISSSTKFSKSLSEREITAENLNIPKSCNLPQNDLIDNSHIPKHARSLIRSKKRRGKADKGRKEFFRDLNTENSFGSSSVDISSEDSTSIGNGGSEWAFTDSEIDCKTKFREEPNPPSYFTYSVLTMLKNKKNNKSRYVDSPKDNTTNRHHYVGESASIKSPASDEINVLSFDKLHQFNPDPEFGSDEASGWSKKDNDESLRRGALQCNYGKKVRGEEENNQDESGYVDDDYGVNYLQHGNNGENGSSGTYGDDDNSKYMDDTNDNYNADTDDFDNDIEAYIPDKELPQNPSLEIFSDDILIQILARIPGNYSGPSWQPFCHVSKRWRHLIQSERFFKIRSEIGKSESWLVTLTCRLEGGLLCKVFDPISQKCQRMNCSWDALVPSRKFFSYASVDKYIYVIGGIYESEKLASDNDTGSSSNSGSFGSNSDIITDKCDKFNPFLNLCHSLPPLSSPRSHMACCSGDGKIYVMGGLDKDGNETDVAEVYNPKENKWTRIANLLEPRHNCLCEYSNGKVFLLRGRFNSQNDYDHFVSVHVYHVINDSWHAIAKLPIGGADFKCAILHDKLCVIGGVLPYLQNHQRCFHTPLIYDEEVNEWKIWRHGIPPLALRSLGGAWHRLQCNHHACIDYHNRPFAIVVLNNELYMIRRCINAYCRHIHRFRSELALSGDSLAWECILRTTRFSNLLREAGDCWQHAVAICVKG